MSTWLDIIRPTGWPITIDILCKMRCNEFLHFFSFRIPNFWIGIPISQFFNSRIWEKFSDRNLWNWKRNQNSAYNGGPRNWNQKMEFPTKPDRWTDGWTDGRRNKSGVGFVTYGSSRLMHVWFNHVLAIGMIITAHASPSIIGPIQNFRCDKETGHKMVSICKNRKSCALYTESQKLKVSTFHLVPHSQIVWIQ